MPAYLPAHVFVYKAGRVWAAICMRCAMFLAASPKKENLHPAVVLHTCQEKKQTTKAKARKHVG
ncbi:MAG: hypothetical protein JO187_13185 [Acidobacteria bacterium]|nr:hypothetical protein [Acidobacteriota bacterium]